MATLKNSIQEILNNGTTKPKEIKDILQRRYGKTTTLGSIYAIKSNLKDKKQGDNNNSNYDSNLNNLEKFEVTGNLYPDPKK